MQISANQATVRNRPQNSSLFPIDADTGTFTHIPQIEHPFGNRRIVKMKFKGITCSSHCVFHFICRQFRPRIQFYRIGNSGHNRRTFHKAESPSIRYFFSFGCRMPVIPCRSLYITPGKSLQKQRLSRSQLQIHLRTPVGLTNSRLATFTIHRIINHNRLRLHP